MNCPFRVFFWHSSWVCYKNLGHEEKLQGVLTQLKLHDIIRFLLNGFNSSELHYIDILLFLNMYADSDNSRLFFNQYYKIFVPWEMQTIEKLADLITNWDLRKIDFNEISFRLFCSCNDTIRSLLETFLCSYDHTIKNFWDFAKSSIGRPSCDYSRPSLLCAGYVRYRHNPASNIRDGCHHWRGRRIFSVKCDFAETILGIKFCGW